ncbi:MAG TPA: hypothetical protein VEK57_06975 [Thermoanaerobaculia bacterium]|nr:hypothetical protein [Thermoanaerobaculia bacterium]
MAVWLRLQSFQTATGAELRDPEGSTTIAEGRTPRTPADSGQIVPVNPDGTTIEGTANGTRGPLAARDQRYRELLQSPPPPAPAPPRAPDKSSLLDRMVAPIASALGMSQKPKVQPPPVPAPAQPNVQEQRASADRSQPGRSTETVEPEQQIDDEESDIVPPRLLSAEFTPNEVQDGEFTMFSATIDDNRSGVRSVSGVIASPSGSLQGFSCTREGETTRFVARVTIPKEAPAGIWTVRYLTLTDNASNSINLNASQGALPASTTFKVISSRSDASGPQLVRIWLEKEAMRAGERNTAFILAEDDQAGVSQVSGTFVSPAKTARIGFGCRLGGTGAWECSVAPPACLDCGNWRLEQVQLQDKANNLTTFRGDNQLVSAVTLNIAGMQCDSAPPVITSLAIEPPVVSNAQPSQITVRAIASDDLCGVASLSGQAIPPGGVGGQRRPILFKPTGEGGFTGTIDIPAMAAKGLWTLTWVQALDKGHNLRAYSTSDPVVSRATFQVE